MINCQVNHSSNSKACPKWLVERDIQSIKVKQNVSFPEARQSVEARNNAVKGQSYATVAKSGVQISTKMLKMLGTLDPGTKHDWKSYIAPLVQVYNATRNDATGYAPHYLMFGWHPR